MILTRELRKLVRAKEVDGELMWVDAGLVVVVLGVGDGMGMEVDEIGIGGDGGMEMENVAE